MPDNDYSQWVDLPTDPNTGRKVISISPQQSNIQLDPATGVTYPTSDQVVDKDKMTGPLAKLLGEGGNERFKTWPERIVESGAMLPGDVATKGRLAPLLDGKWSDEDEARRALTDTAIVDRSQDLAALAGGAPLAETPGVATLGSGMTRMAKKAGNEDLAYLLKPKSAIDIIGKETGDIKSNGISNLKVQDAPDGYDANRLIYSEDGKILGAMQITKIPSSDTYKVANTYVAPEARRQGIATKLNEEGKKLFGSLESSDLEASPAGQAFRKSVLRSDTSQPGVAVAAAKDAPVFYSAVENAVNNAKQNVATADQWKGFLKNQPGVKQEELDWTLGDLPDGKITKQQLQDHVAANKVQLQEVDKSYNSNFENLDDEDKPYDQTKFQSYQLPGGDNYQEKLLTLPTDKVQAYAIIYKDGTQMGGSFSSKAEAEATLKELFPNRKDLEIVPEVPTNDGVRTGIKYNPDTTYKSSHWDEPNVLAHVRMNDRNVEGNKTLHLEEIQSDWHQTGRKSGYKLDPVEKQQLEANSDAVDNKLIAANAEHIMGNPDLEAGLKQAVQEKIISQKEADDYLKLGKNENATVPNAPFKTTWPDLVLKRMIRHAAEESHKSEVANWEKLVQNEPDRLAHMFVKDGTLKEICD